MGSAKALGQNRLVLVKEEEEGQTGQKVVEEESKLCNEARASGQGHGKGGRW